MYTAEEKALVTAQANGFLKATHEDIRDVSRSFFRIGFRLAEARKCKYFEVLGYDSIEALAEEQFGFGRSTTYGLMQVWSDFKDFKNPMLITSSFAKYSYSQLLELSKSRWSSDSLPKEVPETASVRDIRGYVRYWNKIYDKYQGGRSPDSFLKWKANEMERLSLEKNAEQLVLPGVVEEVPAAVEESEGLTEKDFKTLDKIISMGKDKREGQANHAECDPDEFDYAADDEDIDEDDVENDEYTETVEEDEEEVQTSGREEAAEPRYRLNTRDGVRVFLDDYKNWDQRPVFSIVYTSRHVYRISDNVRLDAYGIKKCVNPKTLEAYDFVRYYLFIGHGSTGIEMTKMDLEQYFAELYKEGQDE